MTATHEFICKIEEMQGFFGEGCCLGCEGGGKLDFETGFIYFFAVTSTRSKIFLFSPSTQTRRIPE